MTRPISHHEKPAKSSQSQKKPSEIGIKRAKSKLSEPQQTSVDTTLIPSLPTESTEELPRSIAELVAPSKKKTLKGKLIRAC